MEIRDGAGGIKGDGLILSDPAPPWSNMHIIWDAWTPPEHGQPLEDPGGAGLQEHACE